MRTTIGISLETKNRFKEALKDFVEKSRKNVSENEFLNILLDLYYKNEETLLKQDLLKEAKAIFSDFLRDFKVLIDKFKGVLSGNFDLFKEYLELQEKYNELLKRTGDIGKLNELNEKVKELEERVMELELENAKLKEEKKELERKLSEGFKVEDILKDEKILDAILAKIPPRKLFWKFMENSVIYWRSKYPKDSEGYENAKIAEQFLIDIANRIFIGDYPSPGALVTLRNKIL